MSFISREKGLGRFGEEFEEGFGMRAQILVEHESSKSTITLNRAVDDDSETFSEVQREIR